MTHTSHRSTATEQTTDDQPQGLTRRSLLGGGAAGALGLAMAGTLAPLARAGAVQTAGGAGPGAGYGPLVEDPAGLLSLPRRFHYTVVAETGVTRLESGEVSPDNYDGTAAFARPGGGTILVANHEIRPPVPENPHPIGVPHVADLVYDSGVHGGTTTIEVDDENNRVTEYVSLAGTSTNCAGGRTPWNTWLTCEETFAPAGATKAHGYVFEVDPYDREANKSPAPIIALGRFEHEAVSVDPDTGQIYETEDANGPHGLLYQWTPPADAVPLGKGVLRSLPDDAGELKALRAYSGGVLVPDLCVATEPGTSYDVEWAPVPDRTASTALLRQQFNGTWGGSTFTDRPGGDVTRSRKLEGSWWGDGGAYVVASFARTGDGSAVQHDGQVWFYDPLEETLTLKLRFAYTPPPDDSDPDGPDNITVSPYGGVILAEDGEGRQHLVGATESGETFFLARNEVGDGSGEMTGPTFSRSKATLFANLFTPGHVYAINGPWRRVGRDG